MNIGDMTGGDVPWRERMRRLIDRMAGNCHGCLYKGARCASCDCATAAGIVRDRDAEEKANPDISHRMKPAVRRARVAEHMAGRGWLKPADILWPCKVPANIRTMDLAELVAAGVVERKQPDPANARVFVYRMTGKMKGGKR